MKYKKLFLINSITNVCLYTLAYLIKIFYLWQIINPFQWVIDLPKYTPDDRLLGLWIFICWQGLQVCIINGIITPLKKESIQETN